MSDEADITEERMETMLAANVAMIRHRGLDAEPTGYCLNCGPDVPLPDGRRFCDRDCLDDWQKRSGK